MGYIGISLDDRIYELRNKYCEIKTIIGKISFALLFFGIGCWLYSYSAENPEFMVYGNVLTILFIPTILSYFGIDDVERAALSRLKTDYEKEMKRLRIKQRREYKERTCDDVRTYTIGISLDYTSRRKLTDENKRVLSKMTFMKLKGVLNKLCPDAIVDVMPNAALVSSSYSSSSLSS